MKRIFIGLLAVSIVAFGRPVARSFSRPSVSRSYARPVSRSVSVSRPKPVSVRPKTTVTHKATYTAPKTTPKVTKTTTYTAPKSAPVSNFSSSSTTSSSSTPVVVESSSGNSFLTNMLLFNAIRGNNNNNNNQKVSSDEQLIKELELKLEKLKKEKVPNKELIERIEKLIAELKRK